MGFFKKSVSSELKRTGLTIIAKGNKISGDVVIAGKLHVDGSIEGSVTSIENVSIGKTGEVKGKLKAKNITVSGLFEGELECDHLHIVAGGKVVGSVVTFDLVMEAKSHFFGECREKQTELQNIKPATQAVNIDYSIEKTKSDDEMLYNLPNKVTLTQAKEVLTTSAKTSDKEVDIDLNGLSFSSELNTEDSLAKNADLTQEQQLKSAEGVDEMPQDSSVVDKKVPLGGELKESALDSEIEASLSDKVKSADRAGSKKVDDNTKVVELEI